MADKPTEPPAAPKKVMEPVGAPDSPPYANGYIVQKDGEVVTLLFMRVPPTYTEALVKQQNEATVIPTPVISSVTLTLAGAKEFVGLLSKLLSDEAK